MSLQKWRIRCDFFVISPWQSDGDISSMTIWSSYCLKIVSSLFEDLEGWNMIFGVQYQHCCQVITSRRISEENRNAACLLSIFKYGFITLVLKIAARNISYETSRLAHCKLGFVSIDWNYFKFILFTSRKQN